METLWLKLHLGFLLISIVVFLGRNVLAFAKPDLANHKLALIATMGSMLMVLISAGLLASNSAMETAWLMEKGIGLVGYVILGILALKPTTAVVPRLGLSLVAIAFFAATVMVAKQHAPMFL
ncbi:SirB2 family protein [Terasakiella sp. A23]|uniref:SirB2 family protein n=1 Tax=Terasakiella sp. FCG-A23 TaxID=3080561 RepID=UPI00295518BD|nr:SirB2 family protein [Terasakiella sp. A23]MDV7341788.1 SirB2 family protein [Terasakiella sp. A23]